MFFVTLLKVVRVGDRKVELAGDFFICSLSRSERNVSTLLARVVTVGDRKLELAGYFFIYSLLLYKIIDR